jgi:hypothetical protein
MERSNTYRIFGIYIIHYASLLGGLHNSCGLNGDEVPKTFAFTIHNAWYEDIASYINRFSGFNDDIVRCYSLRLISDSAFLVLTGEDIWRTMTRAIDSPSP